MAEYRFSNGGSLRAEAGLGKAIPYDGLVTEVTTAHIQFSRSHALLSYEHGGLLVRGWWNGLFPETVNRIFPPFIPLLNLTDRFGNTHEDSSFNTYDFETRYRFMPLETLNLNVGVNFRRIIHSSNTLSNRTMENRLGLYAQGDWMILPSLEVSAGLRYDLDSFITPTLSPRGAIVYHLNSNHALRLTSSLAYRPPTTFDIGLSLLSPVMLPGFLAMTTAVVGSSDVKPEQIISHEFGYQGWWWQHRLRTRVTGFYNHISDLIAFRNPTGNPLNPSRPVNGGVADIYGGEVGAEFLLTSWLSGFTNYAYQEVGQTSSGFSRRGFPHHKVNAGLRMNWNPFRAEVLYHHVGAASYPLADSFTNLAPFLPAGTVLPVEQVPSYHLLNLRLGYLLWRQQTVDYVREAELAVSVFNALNDQHREHPLGDILGTRVMGWLTVKL